LGFARENRQDPAPIRKVVIVDNASAEESLAMIEDLRGTMDRLAMIRSDRNTGVAQVLWSVWESITGNRDRPIP